MSKGLKILGMALAVLVLLGTGAFYYIKSMPIPEVNVGNIDLDSIEDGVYRGEYTAGPVQVGVRVLVKDNQIIDIEIIEHQNGLGTKAETIVEAIIGQQSLDVDAVSGATLSSNVIRKAVEVALESGPTKEEN